ncbi:MAG: sulfite exporter TauE/SafE family protein [Dehalococcoidia bacterium]
MDPTEVVALLLVALAAGAVNAIAGGGSLISFPALIVAGYPAKQANVTNTVAVVPGLSAVTFGYRRELRGEGRRLLVLSAVSLAGAAAGAALLLSTPSDAFRRIVPYLIFLATGLTAFQDPIAAWATRHRMSTHGPGVPVALAVATFILGAYNGYFGAGYGLMMLPVVAILLNAGILTAQAMRAFLSVVGNVMAVVLFGIFGPVAWGAAAVLGVGFVAGGFAGTSFARAIPAGWLRALIVVYGLTAGVALLVT